ncbi:MAG: DUF58 domain-containing protein [Planctomycetota bacterium]
MIRRKKTHRDETAKRTWLEWLAWIAITDHCPWANIYVAQLRTPLGVMLMSAMCALLCGLFIAPQGFAVFGAITSVVLIGLAWPWIAMRGISCRVVFVGQRGREGQPTPAKLVVTNRWPWPVWGLAVDDPLSPERDRGPAVALARINGWSRSTFDCSFTPKRRGRFPKPGVSLGTGFPFGLYQSTKPVTAPQPLIVWPQTFWLPPIEVGAPRRHWTGVLSDSLTGTQGTRHGVRTFRPGDELRDVHWAKSARHDQLIVNEREASTVQRLALFVDVEPARHAGSGADSSLEWTLRIAASICESVAAQQGVIELWLGQKQLVAEGKVALGGVLDAIALLDPSDEADSVAPTRRPPVENAVSAIAIGTDASPTRCEHSIVLDARGFGSQRLAADKRLGAWIPVSSPDDVPGQVLRGWRIGRRRVSRAT